MVTGTAGDRIMVAGIEGDRVLVIGTARDRILVTDSGRVLVIETGGDTAQMTETDKGRTLVIGVQEGLILPHEALQGATRRAPANLLLKVMSRTHPSTESRGSTQ